MTRLNERCPCGSGKKYKKCCHAIIERPLPTETPVQEGNNPRERRPDPFLSSMLAMVSQMNAAQDARLHEALELRQMEELVEKLPDTVAKQNAKDTIQRLRNQIRDR